MDSNIKACFVACFVAIIFLSGMIVYLELDRQHAHEEIKDLKNKLYCDGVSITDRDGDIYKPTDCEGTGEEWLQMWTPIEIIPKNTSGIPTWNPGDI